MVVVLLEQAQISIDGGRFSPLDLAPDGKRFAVMPKPAAGEGEQKVNLHAVFLPDFFDELKRKIK